MHLLAALASLFLLQDAPSPALVCGTAAASENRECQAQLAVKEGRAEDAAAIFMAIAAEATNLVDTARAQAAAASLFLQAGQHEAALEAASAAAGANVLAPLQQGWTLLDKAYSLHRLERYDEANSVLASAGTLIQDDPFYWLAATQMAGEQGDYDAALTRITQAEQRAPDAPEVLYAKGEVLLARGDRDGARAAWTAAIAAMPDHPVAMMAQQAIRDHLDAPLAATSDVTPEEPAQ
ncbi:tetratricopeptide repeat protein [Sphingomicrobium arenosum]|uniref:tetratricopeptide repeat protein n=1 Tax=Sphingomicrobium arenosum TaxID=2233861 RepID=UPI002240EDB6|nr:tetratricopeptide repeat protein [Sphingomicrobium arenosum]